MFPRDYLESDSIAYKVIRGRKTFSEVPYNISADTWFDCQENNEYEITEQTIRVADNEVLSIIVFVDERMLEDKEY